MLLNILRRIFYRKEFESFKQNYSSFELIKKCLEAGDFVLFDRLIVLLSKELGDKKWRNLSPLIIVDLVDPMIEGLSVAISKRDSQGILAMFNFFTVSDIDLRQNRNVLSLKPKVLKMIDSCIDDVFMTETGDSTDGIERSEMKDIILIQRLFNFPDSIYDNPNIFRRACQKAGREVMRYFLYESLEPILILGGKGYLASCAMPLNILHSPEVVSAVEKQLIAYIRNSDIESARKFSAVFHYRDLGKLISDKYYSQRS